MDRRSGIPHAGRFPGLVHNHIPLPTFPLIHGIRLPIHSDGIAPGSHRIPFYPIFRQAPCALQNLILFRSQITKKKLPSRYCQMPVGLSSPASGFPQSGLMGNLPLFAHSGQGGYPPKSKSRSSPSRAAATDFTQRNLIPPHSRAYKPIQSEQVF